MNRLVAAHLLVMNFDEEVARLEDRLRVLGAHDRVLGRSGDVSEDQPLRRGTRVRQGLLGPAHRLPGGLLDSLPGLAQGVAQPRLRRGGPEPATRMAELASRWRRRMDLSRSGRLGP
jgi:hypothetical protein